MLGLGLRLGASLASPFTPARIPDLTSWLDAADTDTITQSGGLVSQIDDKSGNGNHAVQSTTAQQPTTGATTVNGLNVLDSDGADQLDVTNAAGIDPGTDDFTIFMSLSLYDGIYDWRKFLSFGLGSALELATHYSGAIVLIEPLIGTEVIYTPSTLDDGLHLLCMRWNGATFEFFYDGNRSVSTAITELTASSALALFSAEGSYWGLEGSCGEVIMYDRALDDTELSSVNNYLIDKWGI